MLPFEDRYSRQRRLLEVGQAGQAKLAAAKLRVAARAGDESWLEVLYLHRAGVGQVLLSRAVSPLPFTHNSAFRFDETRAIAAGAQRALLQLRAALGIIEPLPTLPPPTLPAPSGAAQPRS